MSLSTADESTVGAAQNILGNGCGGTEVEGLLNNLSLFNPLDEFSVVGSIADEKNDSLYWMLASNIESQIPLLADNEEESG